STQLPISSASVSLTQNDSPAPGSFVSMTNASGQYVLTVPSTGPYSIAVNGIRAGVAHVNASTFRGDVLIDRGGMCTARYGVVLSSHPLRPVGGATINFGDRPSTGADGWYRLDLGCATEPSLGGGTTFMTVSHPNYQTQQVPLGRGVSGVFRLDILLNE